jgi:hypothetical protein
VGSLGKRAQLITQAHQRLRRNSRTETGRQSPFGSLLDGGKNIFAAAAVKLARRILRDQRHAHRF